jgi:hypothetical protein
VLTRKRDIQVRDFDDFDDLAMAVIELENLRTGYSNLNLNVPDWLAQKLDEGKIELGARVRVQKQRKIAQLKIRRESLMTNDEKRASVEQEIEKLEKDLTPEAV